MIHEKITVAERNVFIDGKEVFRAPFPGEQEIEFVGLSEGNLIITAHGGCCPPGNVYVIGKDETSDCPYISSEYNLKRIFATLLPIHAILPTREGMLTVAHGCYSGVRFTRNDGSRIDIIDENSYSLLRGLEHDKNEVPYGGWLKPVLVQEGDKILLQMDLLKRIPDPRLLTAYFEQKKLGKNPFPIRALTHETDTYQRKDIVEQVDLTDKLHDIGVEQSHIMPFDIGYSRHSLRDKGIIEGGA